MPERRKKRLSQLKQAIERGDFASASKLLAASGGRPAKSPSGPPAPRSSGPKTLQQACGGEEAAFAAAGGELHCYLVRRSAAELDSGASSVAADYAAVMRGARQRFDELAASAALCCVADARPADLLFVKAEARPGVEPVVFLVGMMFHSDGQLMLEQYLARDETEEGAVLTAFADRHASAGVLVTFSGRRSQLKLIHGRCELHEVDLTAEAWEVPAVRATAGSLPHLDLRKEARRRWRDTLPNCGPAALEKGLCARHRVPRIGGMALPEAYEQFVATGDAGIVGEILHHNGMDLLTMVQVVFALLTGCERALQ